MCASGLWQVFSVAGTSRREFCSRHATDGMVHLIKKKCAYQGCSTRASYGVMGTKTESSVPDMRRTE